MRYEEIRCRVCGSERLEKQNDGTYVCKHCRSRFRENDLEEYKKTIRSELRGVVTEALVCQRAQDVANIRRNLFEALQEEYTDSYKIIGYCRDLKRLLPNDFQANCFETLNNGGKKEVNAMLKSVDEKGAGRFYVKDILEFMVKSLMPANLLPLKSLAERALKDEEKTEYLNKIEEEAGKCEAGLYSPEVPRKAFIAYSSKDMAIVTPLVEYLENAGISCFVALRNMRHGRKAVENYDKILQRAMHNCKSFVLVSTRNSRRFDCDAIEKELPYVRDNEPNVKRIEYLVEDYGENEGAIKSTLKDFFGGSEWVRNLEDLPSRIMDIKQQTVAAPAIKYCLSCGAGNVLAAIFCNQCGKREFGAKEEYEERQKELERLESEQKEAERREAERKEAERKDAEAAERSHKGWNVVAQHNLGEHYSKVKESVSYERIGFGKDTEKMGDWNAISIPIGLDESNVWHIDLSCQQTPPIANLVVGVPGTGKSTLIDAMILNGAIKYSPDELNFQLLDFKDGISSSAYTRPECQIPHIKVVSRENKPEDAGIILSNIMHESERRNEEFKALSVESGVQIRNIADYNMQVASGKYGRRNMPRLVIVIDECQCLFDDEVLAKQCETIVRKCRAQGIHLILATQSLSRKMWNTIKFVDGRYCFEIAKGDAEQLLDQKYVPFIATDVPKGSYMAFASNDSGRTAQRIKIAFYGKNADNSDRMSEYAKKIREKWSNYPIDLFVVGDKSPCPISQNGFIDKAKQLKTERRSKIVTHEKAKCNECGGVLERQDDGIYLCPYCGASYWAERSNDSTGYSETGLVELRCSRCGGRLKKTGDDSYTCFYCLTCYTIEEIYCQQGNRFYEQGNYIEAVKWYRKAADQGDKNAQKALEQMKEAERGEVEQKKSEEKIETTAASKAEAKAVSVASSDPADFEIEDGVLKDYRGKGGDVVIPNGVTCIGGKAFKGCISLTRITIPSSVTRIGDWAFKGCFSLLRITIPSSVTSIGEGAFYHCSNLTSITIPKSVTSIGDSAFEICDGLTSITIPKSVTSIGDKAFSGCSGLKSIDIPNSVTSIGQFAFLTCSGLTDIDIPSSVTIIGYGAFCGCSGLTSITIPNSVTSIGEGAFFGCSGLTRITIPRNVTSIRRVAFDNCREDLKIYCHDKKPLKWPRGWDVSLKDKIIWDE